MNSFKAARKAWSRGKFCWIRPRVKLWYDEEDSHLEDECHTHVALLKFTKSRVIITIRTAYTTLATLHRNHVTERLTTDGHPSSSIQPRCPRRLRLMDVLDAYDWWISSWLMTDGCPRGLLWLWWMPPPHFWMSSALIECPPHFCVLEPLL